MKSNQLLTSNSGTFFEKSTNGNSLTKNLMKRRATKMNKETMISKKTSKRKFKDLNFYSFYIFENSKKDPSYLF